MRDSNDQTEVYMIMGDVFVISACSEDVCYRDNGTAMHAARCCRERVGRSYCRMHMLARQAGAWRVAVLRICIRMQRTYGQPQLIADRGEFVLFNHACIHVRIHRHHDSAPSRCIGIRILSRLRMHRVLTRLWTALEERPGL